MIKNTIRTVGLATAGFLLAVLCAALIALHTEISTAITDAIRRCLEIIIPSLFAFMALSDLLIRTGTYRYVLIPFYPIYRWILRMPQPVFFAFIMGNIAGYPVGIRILSMLVRQNTISQHDAARYACFCYAGGPAFAVGAVGGAVFGDIRIGLMLFLSCFAANFAGAFLYGLFRKKNTAGKTLPPHTHFRTDDLTGAVESAARAMLMICAMIVFFAALLSILESTGIFALAARTFGCTGNQEQLLRAVVEISYTAKLTGTPYALLPWIAAVLSFGGLCVHAQVASVCKNAFSLKLFWLTRPAFAALAGLAAHWLSPLFVPKTLPAAVSSPIFAVKTHSIVPSVCLIFMIILIFAQKRLVIRKKICYND